MVPFSVKAEILWQGTWDILYETRGRAWLHLEMSGHLSFRDENTATGDTLVSSKEINEGGGFIW